MLTVMNGSLDYLKSWRKKTRKKCLLSRLNLILRVSLFIRETFGFMKFFVYLLREKNQVVKHMVSLVSFLVAKTFSEKNVWKTTRAFPL